MRHADGREAKVGDRIAIDGDRRGFVVACLDRGDYAAGYPAADWRYLERGLLVETDFGGLIHYPDAGAEGFELLRRDD